MKKIFKSIANIAIGLVALSAASLAQAIPVGYAWSGATSNDGWTAEGLIVVDDSSFGTTLNGNTDFLDWMFSWTNGTTTHAVSLAGGGMFANGFSSLSLSPTGVIGAYDLCTASVCSAVQHPIIRVHSTFGWIATTSQRNATGQNAFTSGSNFSGPTPVSAPPALALLGAGLLAFGAVRRKKIKG